MMAAQPYQESMPRLEDPRLLTGAGAFTADLRPADLCHAVFVRSPHAHARIDGIDVDAARRVPGVHAVITAADLVADAVVPLSSPPNLKRPDGRATAPTPRPLLVGDVARHIGEPVAMIVAETRELALDAAEQVSIDYSPLAAVLDCQDAVAPGAPSVWAETPDNIAFLWRCGDHDGVADSIAGAAHVTRLEYGVSRVAASPLEPRVTLALPGPGGKLTVHSSTQNPYQLRNLLAKHLRLGHDQIRVIARDVGGAFGMKAGLFREDALVALAAKRLGRPVRWMSDRNEAFLSDDQARDVRFKAALALDGEGRFLALQVRYDINVGAYVSGRSQGPITNIGSVAGVYRTPKIAAEVYGVLTNTLPTAPYRGAGRPDATFVIERIIDVAARELGIDPIELRRRNLIPADAMPFKTGLLFVYDCGEFAANMDAAAIRADLTGFAARKAEAARRGKLRGIGVCNPIEVAGGPFGNVLSDQSRIVVQADGAVHVHTGAMSVGQGLETAFTQFVAARLGVPVSSVHYHQGDTTGLPDGRGSGGSSGLCVSGSAVAMSVEKAIETGREVAADLLEAAAADIVFADGRFSIVGTDRSVAWVDVARRAETKIADGTSERGLIAVAKFQPPSVTFPNGCHICEVEVDPDTGAVDVINYVAVEDIGRVLNPMLAHGQIHGGVAQGMGQALCEQVIYESGSGQLLTGSFMDYAMPRATDVPAVSIEMREVPTQVNPLGAKGVGEAGTVGALAATINAICDALAPMGVTHIDMPATPARIWAAIQSARAGSDRNIIRQAADAGI